MPRPSRVLPWLSATLCALFCSQAMARTQCPSDTLLAHPPTINFRADNDLFGGDGQDQGYTNGAALSLVSPNLYDYTGDPCLPWLARWLNRHLEHLHPGRFDQQNMVFTLGQGLFTPDDPERRDLIRDDRPYAAVLLASFGYNARNEDHLRTNQLQLGVVGPAALGRQAQSLVHRFTDSKKFHGWDHQLHNEPVFRLIHERMRRWPERAAGPGDGWSWDAIGHWGAALGNLSTYANVGGELRFGWKLPDDFGSSPLRPAGENTAPTMHSRRRGWSAHLFVTTDARWVLRDITLDGNTFRSSHSVHKRPFVADIGYGIALWHGRWKFALARYHRSREFDGQRQTPVFGSFTIGRML